MRGIVPLLLLLVPRCAAELWLEGPLDASLCDIRHLFADETATDCGDHCKPVTQLWLPDATYREGENGAILLWSLLPSPDAHYTRGRAS